MSAPAMTAERRMTLDLRARTTAAMAECEALAERMDHRDFIRMSETIPRTEFCNLVGIDYSTLTRYRSGALSVPRWVMVITILLHWTR